MTKRFLQAKTDLVIGSTLGNDGESSEIVVGDTSNQQVWIDYIDAHNKRDLETIARNYFFCIILTYNVIV